METRLDKFTNWALPVLAGLTVALALSLNNISHINHMHQSAEQSPPQPSPVPEPVSSFHQAVQKAAPAVVNVYSLPGPRQDTAGPRQPRSLGSGVIADRRGYILTNHHVIKGTQGLVVALTDGREAPARVVGTDPETDLAVLKVDLGPLPVITFALSRDNQVGDIVLAIGNPFGLGQTVSQGIISARQRELHLNTYESFLQTDAAISVGNSGGALVNSRGHLVGISTALLSSDGGNEGLGFAIPANLAYKVLSDIVERGRVVRGWLGLDLDLPEKPVTLKDGVPVLAIQDASPAAAAGLRAGDLLVRIEGQQVTSARQVVNRVADLAPGSRITLVVRRGDNFLDLEARVGERPAMAQPQALSQSQPPARRAPQTARPGLEYRQNGTQSHGGPPATAPAP